MCLLTEKVSKNSFQGVRLCSQKQALSERFAHWMSIINRMWWFGSFSQKWHWHLVTTKRTKTPLSVFYPITNRQQELTVNAKWSCKPTFILLFFLFLQSLLFSFLCSRGINPFLRHDSTVGPLPNFSTEKSARYRSLSWRGNWEGRMDIISPSGKLEWLDKYWSR